MVASNILINQIAKKEIDKTYQTYMYMYKTLESHDYTTPTHVHASIGKNQGGGLYAGSYNISV